MAHVGTENNMALLNQSTQVYAQLQKFLETLRAGTAPSSFTRQFLKDIGFKSSNHHQFIPLLKGLGFLTADGTPTSSIPSFYTTENIPLNDLHPNTVSAKRAMRGESLCSGMVGINS